MAWKCPLCGFEANDDAIIRCSCGYELPIRQETHRCLKIRARKISGGSLYKLLLIGTSIPLLLFSLVCGVASIYGADTVLWNEKPITGIMGFISAIIMYPVSCVIAAGFAWLGIVFGLWIYSRFRKIEITFVDGEVVPDASAGLQPEAVCRKTGVPADDES